VIPPVPNVRPGGEVSLSIADSSGKTRIYRETADHPMISLELVGRGSQKT
jgi:hypothetical protein